MQVSMIACTHFDPWMIPIEPWFVQREGEVEEAHPDLLIEFAGRNCYQSWANPGKKTNAEYIKNIIEHGHGSVLEHASATFFITGASRSLTHELIRHRHGSYSELSQRFVDVEEVDHVVPPLFKGDGFAEEVIRIAVDDARNCYQRLVERAEEKGATRKQAREAARCVMPNCIETAIVMSGNFRAWRGFIDARANEHADAEICALAVEIATQLKDRFPNVFQDYIIEGGYAWTHNRKV